MELASKRDLVKFYGDAFSTEVQIDIERYPLGSKEREGFIADAEAEWDYWNGRAVKRNKDAKMS